MRVYSQRQSRLPTQPRALAARLKLISTSFIALMRFAYLKYGLIGVCKNIIDAMAHLDIVLMMTRSSTKIVLKYHPDLLNGGISDPYMSTLFNKSRQTRCDIFTFHYKYITATLQDTFYELVVGSGLALWRATIDGELLSICLELEKKHRREGDLTLSFEMNRLKIYQLSFTILPGHLVGCSTGQVLLVGRVQGVKNRLNEIRRATKSCKDVAPPYLLVSAAQAIALALDIGLVAGVNGREQLSSTLQFPFDYDSFWKTCSATQTHRNFYVFPASFVGKPFDQASFDHRRRRRLKRQFKSRINECVRIAFAEKCLRV